MRTTSCIRSLLLGTLLLPLGVACSGGGDDGEATITVSITDAASDDLTSFVVDVTNVQLTRTGGAVVGVLDEPVTVDLVTLQDASQILNLVNVPVATYVAASITLDFANANIFLVDQTTAATVLDSEGNPITGEITLPVTIGNALSTAAGRHRILELDFDLDQSVEVDTGANTARLEPAIVLRVDRTDPKELIVAGAILGVDTPTNTVRVELQTLAGDPISTITIGVTDTTIYQVNGVPSTGSDGLSALAGLATDTWIQCYGAINTFAARIDAVYVEAGTGTYNGGNDIVEGYITGRVGAAGTDPMLTVIGNSDNSTHTAFMFNTSFAVNVNFTDTKILMRGSTQSCDADDLNIGQRVRFFGTLSGTTLDATAATAVARIRPTRIYGFANGAPSSGELEIDLERVGLRNQSVFNWGESGTSTPTPATFSVDVASLADGLGITAATPIEIEGTFPAVDDDTEDFDASSVTNRNNAPSLLLIHDRIGPLTVAPSIQAGSISFALSGTPGLFELAIIDRGFVAPATIPFMPEPTVTAAAALGVYAIRDRTTGAVAVFLDYQDFLDVLDSDLQGGSTIYNFGALGMYDDMANSLAASLVTVALN